MKKIFITATDTDAGKTHVAQVLINALVRANKKVSAFKPISAGCEWLANELVNEDAVRLQGQINTEQSISQINPIAFEPAIAPHIAAAQLNETIEISSLVDKYNDIDNKVDFIITEGAGGWRLPLGNGVYLSEFAQITQQQVILVVNMKLGCLNHAILTYQAIINDGVKCIGWVANSIETMAYLEENITELTQLLPIPLLGHLHNESNIDKAVAQLTLPVLF